VLLEGVRLMVVGMTTVFAFLTLLVLAMQINRVVGAMFPDPEPVSEPPGPSDEDRHVAVVLAAIAAARGGR
jgi:sodium pump decarboxylase gamma subunit